MKAMVVKICNSKVVRIGKWVALAAAAAGGAYFFGTKRGYHMGVKDTLATFDDEYFEELPESPETK